MGKRVALQGTLTAGQNGWSRVALYNNPAAAKVRINGRLALKLGSGGEEHSRGRDNRGCYVIDTSRKVRIHGEWVAREGDPVSDGDVLSGDGVSSNVYFG